MSTLANRRRLLLAESEMHRGKLADEWRSLSDQTVSLRERARAGVDQAAHWAGAAVAFVAALRLLSGRSSAAKLRRPPGVLSRLFGLTRTGLSLWLTLRPLFSGVTSRNGGNRSKEFHARPAAR